MLVVKTHFASHYPEVLAAVVHTAFLSTCESWCCHCQFGNVWLGWDWEASVQVYVLTLASWNFLHNSICPWCTRKSSKCLQTFNINGTCLQVCTQNLICICKFLLNNQTNVNKIGLQSKINKIRIYVCKKWIY